MANRLLWLECQMHNFTGYFTLASDKHQRYCSSRESVIDIHTDTIRTFNITYYGCIPWQMYTRHVTSNERDINSSYSFSLSSFRSRLWQDIRHILRGLVVRHFNTSSSPVKYYVPTSKPLANAHWAMDGVQFFL